MHPLSGPPAPHVSRQGSTSLITHRAFLCRPQGAGLKPATPQATCPFGCCRSILRKSQRGWASPVLHREEWRSAAAPSVPSPPGRLPGSPAGLGETRGPLSQPDHSQHHQPLMPSTHQDFPGVQGIRICLPIQGTRVRPLVWEDPKQPRATQLMRLEPRLHDKRRRPNGKPVHCKKRVPARHS